MDYINGGCQLNLIVAIDFTVRSVYIYVALHVAIATSSVTHCVAVYQYVCRAPMVDLPIQLLYTTMILIRLVAIAVWVLIFESLIFCGL